MMFLLDLLHRTRFARIFTRTVTPIAFLIGTALLPIAQQPARAQQQTMQLRANTTEANSLTGVVVARGNVLITYPARKIEATAAQAIYYSKENKIVLSGNVIVLQDGGGNSLKGEVITYLVQEGRFTAEPQEGRQVEATYTMTETPAAAPAPASVPVNPTSAKPAKLPFPMNPTIETPKLPTASPVTTEKPATP